MAKEITRSIRRDVERELWARAAGRCEFRGCNRLVYKSPVTQEKVNISEKAHIYSFSKDGPRGWGFFSKNKKRLNDISNLMLVCHDCHKTIDQDAAGTRYSADLLMEWKRQHETRVRLVTGICPTNTSHVVLYGGKIGEENSPLQFEASVEAMFPDWFPSEDAAINLSMSCEHEDTEPAFWETESRHLSASFERAVRPRILEAKPNHFSIFARANQPLMVLLGSLLTDKVPAEVYQLHREPTTWKWQAHPHDFEFQVIRPTERNHPPVLIFSLSGKVTHDRVTSLLGPDVSIWELTAKACHNDMLKSRQQLALFRETVRKLMVEINQAHGSRTAMRIFPAMPVACAVELGRVRMPKADMPWIIYDQNRKLGGFVETITIGGNHE